jgi:CBS domain-containing protein
MKQYHIRHLPILNHGEIIGVVSDRDLALAFSFTDPKSLTVE